MELDGDGVDLAAALAETSGLSAVQAAAVYTAKLIGRENEVPMVSMDGEAHPNMTLAAVGLGIFVALIILLTLIAFITRRERSSHAKGAQNRSHPSKGPCGLAGQPIETISQKLAASRFVSFAQDCELGDVVTRM